MKKVNEVIVLAEIRSRLYASRSPAPNVINIDRFGQRQKCSVLLFTRRKSSNFTTKP